MAHKRDDDLQDSPASWVARHTGGHRFSRYGQPMKRRSRSDLQSEQAGPLIDRVTNSWRSDPAKWQIEHDEDDPVSRCFDLEDDDSCPNLTARVVKSKRFKRLIAFLLASTIIFGFIWIQSIGPSLAAEWYYKEGFLRMPRGSFGLGRAGDYDPPEKRVVELDKSLIPGGELDARSERRLIFIGDIHGCHKELKALLKAVNFDASTDHLIATGDTISKGPDSIGVLDELIGLKATSVRGNHEDRLLSIANVKTEDAKRLPALTKGAARDAKLVKQLKSRHLDYIHNMPLILRIPPLPQALASDPKHHNSSIISTELLVAHAGLVPAVPLAKQDPYFVMNMRSLQRRTHVPSVSPANQTEDTVPWIELWNWYHARLVKDRGLRGWHIPDLGLELDLRGKSIFDSITGLFLHPGSQHNHRAKAQVVIYGHDSHAGLIDMRWTKGLDSACVRGGELTAMVLNARGESQLHGVQCKNHES